ncbi:xanthine dehydrogenase FAD-binding subunit XdhB [Tetragenococcus halophilus subsp. flandriensis]|uniref:xanthine dehydrogenase subunit XdhB n=1 Tax=Tetragenococcus halophilus TaxID=51669 RepID=UPI0023E92890|nr:xanthine dehydrogenase subunit XdhB [Tetragenococcus halophilus]GMA09299.1 xanthine dehydrogenase FAD-binding subunit XdhB [Tetragenococcus halophilus subsp. flandriensis]
MFDIVGYHEAKSLEEVFQITKKEEDARIVAGGTDVLIKAREGNEDFAGHSLVGITQITEMHDIYLDTNETLVIGALNTFTEIEKSPLVNKHTPMLSQAVSLVGGPQTRHVGTIGGNICNGATSADSAPSLFAYNALLEIHSVSGVKNVPIADFYKGAGWVDLTPGEILVNIKITKENYEAYLGNYTKFAQRHALDIANLSCATLIKENNNFIEDLRICFGVAGPTPRRMQSAENYAKGKKISDDILQQIGVKCLEDVRTRNSWRASKEYRDHLVTILPGRNIVSALNPNI